jgi:hypothetical protein
MSLRRNYYFILLKPNLILKMTGVCIRVLLRRKRRDEGTGIRARLNSEVWMMEVCRHIHRATVECHCAHTSVRLIYNHSSCQTLGTSCKTWRDWETGRLGRIALCFSVLLCAALWRQGSLNSHHVTNGHVRLCSVISTVQNRTTNRAQFRLYVTVVVKFLHLLIPTWHQSTYWEPASNSTHIYVLGCKNTISL